MELKLSNKQVGGKHYKEYPIEPIVFFHANKIPYLEARAIKYVVRHRAKGGAEDVRKAIHFLEMLLELEYGEKP